MLDVEIRKRLPERKNRRAGMSLLTTEIKTKEAERKKIAPEMFGIEPETIAMKAETIFMTNWHWVLGCIF